MEYDDYDEEEGVDPETDEQNLKLFEELQNAQRPPLLSLYNRCIKRVLLGGATLQLTEILVLSVLLHIMSRIAILSNTLKQLLSTIIGVGFLFRWYDTKSSIYILCFSILAYILLNEAKKSRTNQNVSLSQFILPMYSLLFSIVVQLFLLDSKTFTQIRGILMVMAMKFLSLHFDNTISMPNFVEYSSYIFNVASVFFGPWYSISAHKVAIEGNRTAFKDSISNVAKGFAFAALSFLCLVVSSCLLDWLILNEYAYYSRIIVQYKEAASFRFSHYFISYFSEAAVLMSGLKMDDIFMNVDNSKAKKLSCHVTNLWQIEFPHSLTDVVVNWNIPMHNWLKIYVFKPSHKFGLFLAILITYLASSALHGFNFQISVVLLSLGFYSYGEYVLRRKLAKSFDACISARKCQKCDHKYKSRNFYVVLTNLLFLFISLYHLICLGMLFDSTEVQYSGYSIDHFWNKSDFLSVYLALFIFVFGWII